MELQTVDEEFKFESQFQNVSWSDIMEAEESDDPNALRKLLDSSKTGEPELTESPVDECFKTPKALKDNLRTKHIQMTPLSLNDQISLPSVTDENDHPELTSTPTSLQATGRSYADAVRLRSKRGVDDRQCLSPLDQPNKRLSQISPAPCVQAVALSPLNERTPLNDRMQKMSHRRLKFSHNSFDEERVPVNNPRPSKKPKEEDQHKLYQRQKQLDFGKNTIGYERYSKLIPKHLRTKVHPHTPNKNQICSKRSWDGQIRKWRRSLHEWDPLEPKSEEELSFGEAVFAGIDLDGGMEV